MNNKINIFSIRKNLVILTLLLLVFSHNAKAMEPGGSLGHPYRTFVSTSRLWFRGEGLFVQVPADLGETVFASTGSIIIAPFLGVISLSTGKRIIIYQSSAILSHRTFAVIGKGIIGLPFYITKKILWDSPIYLWNVSTGQLPFYERTYTYAGSKELHIIIMPKSKHIGNSGFIGNTPPTFTYKSENCSVRLEGKTLTLNKKTYKSKERINSIRIERDFAVKINGKPVSPEE